MDTRHPVGQSARYFLLLSSGDQRIVGSSGDALVSHTEQGTSARRLGVTYAPEEARHVSCDVLVVGAGPAGIMAAREAALAGASVILLETAALPRHKSCGGMLNEYAQRTLGRIAELPRDVIRDPEWVHFRYYDWDRRIKKPCSLRFCNVDRQRFDAWLLGLLPSGGSDYHGSAKPGLSMMTGYGSLRVPAEYARALQAAALKRQTI